MDSIVGVLVLAIGLAALAVLYTQGTKLLHKSSTREKAVQVAAGRLEMLKAADGKKVKDLEDVITYLNSNTTVVPDSKTNSTEDSNEIFTATVSPVASSLVSLYNNNSGISSVVTDKYVYKVTVKVDWTSPENESIEMSTYVTTSDTTDTGA